MKIYLAGKIQKNCWRHSIVNGLSLVNAEDNIRRNGSWFMPKAIFGQHDYVGPLFCSCGSCHSGCKHGESSHGVGATTDTKHGSRGCTESVDTTAIVEWCLASIATADLVFCWLDAPGAYGSVFEIGYALGRNIDVMVSLSDDYKLEDPHWQYGTSTHDEWFSLEACGHYHSHGTNWTAQTALKSFLTSIGEYHDLAEMPYRDYLKTPHWIEFSAAAKRRSGERCQLCNCGGQLHTHHRTYERRGRELFGDVIVLCKSCHEKFHDVLQVNDVDLQPIATTVPWPPKWLAEDGKP